MTGHTLPAARSPVLAAGGRVADPWAKRARLCLRVRTGVGVLALRQR